MGEAKLNIYIEQIATGVPVVLHGMTLPANPAGTLLSRCIVDSSDYEDFMQWAEKFKPNSQWKKIDFSGMNRYLKYSIQAACHLRFTRTKAGFTATAYKHK